MNLIDVLAMGVRGAENGTVEIYRRGTSTFATQYTTAEGEGTFTPSVGQALDSNGGGVFYVNESVDCLAKNSGGILIRDFTVMVSAPAVEVRSSSFTGIDYITGASAVGNPEDLETLFNLWKIQNGAIDWKVLVNGVSLTIQAAFSSVANGFFNVKASQFGAVGDGVANDTSAIQAAIDDANADGGGIVYFPAGVYRITSTITQKVQVSLMGAGVLASSIVMDHASNNTVTVVTSGFIRHLTISALQSNSGKHIVAETNGTTVDISDCVIGSASLSTGIGVSIAGASTLVRVTNCEFLNAGSGAGARCLSASATGGAVILGSRFTAPATWNGMLIDLGVGGIVVGNIISLAAATAGTGTGIRINGSTFGAVSMANHIPTPGSAGVTVYTTTAPLGMAEHNSSPASGALGPPWTPGTANATHAGSQANFRIGKREYQSDNSGALNVNAAQYETSEVRHTAATVQTLSLGTPPHLGAHFTLVFTNDQGAGSNTITVSTCLGLANFTVNANNKSIYFMKSVENVAAGAGSSSLYWALVGSITNQAI